jgi:type IV pilus assembly protein PilC
MKLSISKFLPFGKVKNEEKMFFARYLALMLKTGVPLTRGIQLLAGQTKNLKFKKALLDIYDNINTGKSIAESLEKHPDIFNELFVNMVRTGEAAGNLEEVLEILAEELKKSNDFRSKIISAIIYPVIIIVVMLLVSFFITFFVFPKILRVYESLNVQVPTLSKILIVTIQFVTSNSYYIFGGLFIFIILFLIWSKTYYGKRAIDALWLKIPIIKDLTQKIYTVQFIRTFSSLISGGIPTPSALEITAKTIKSSYYRDSINIFADGIRGGKKLSDLISEYSNLYSPIVGQMISVGEETGQMSLLLKQLSIFMENEVSLTLENLSKLFEPALMIVLSIVVGFVALATVQLIYASIQSISK